MQRGSVNCPQHGNVVNCDGPDGALNLTGLCAWGHVVNMAPQSLAGPFARHWDPHHANDVEAAPTMSSVPTSDGEIIVDLEQIVADLSAVTALAAALSARVTTLEAALSAPPKVAVAQSSSLLGGK